jgi:predicted nucleotidyltransferase
MEQAVRRLVDELRQQSNVLGIAVFGSAARGDGRPDSDIDVYVLVRDGSWRDVEERDGRNFEFVYSSPEASRAFAERRPDDYVTMWDDARILFDRDGDLEKLREHAKNLRKRGKVVPDERTVMHRHFDAEDQLKAVRSLRNSDPATAALVLHRLLEGLGQLYFDLRGEWTPAPKERLRRIRELEPELSAALDTFYATCAFDKKIAAAEDVVNRVLGSSKRT